MHGTYFLTGKNKPATIVVRVGNNRPDLGTNPICNRFTGFIDEGKPLFLPCNPPMPGAFVSVHMETASGSTQLSICEAFVYTDQVRLNDNFAIQVISKQNKQLMAARKLSNNIKV